ncbi:TetR/AcrR family transcriptional regulator (plasmid) [Sphingobium sp. SJ10-10]|uniref:TetR/AcrR family transcriptional regulator n=1 Tax=unclassified Sphingobium TaxID=2611147 RepID=UPI0007705ADC|nr:MULTISPECIES: TetR/AcrR family transcriptional regulator [unclassified Sphingobium]AMK26528.1 regulatory protein TetR [Sphingobium sp. TKS]MEC6699553.1 TetR/AcrR family transcriptional regulator [Sphingobium sp. SJ10-10]
MSDPDGGKATDAPASKPITSAPKQRRRQPEDVKARILEAALNAFANFGYEGTSTRSVAMEANVSLSLLLYHFGSKDALWIAVVENLFLHTQGSKLLHNRPKGSTAAEHLRAVVHAYVERFAKIPALHRLMTLEGHRISQRLVWLCENYIKEDFQLLCELIAEGQREGSVHAGDPGRLRYAIIALATVPSAVAGEYEYLTGKNPVSPIEIQSSVDFINRLVFKSG